MEEVTKETGHRPSVSMPSLDATDDFPSTTTTAESTASVFESTEPLVPVEPTDTATSTETSENTSEEVPHISTDENSQPVGDPSTATVPDLDIDQASTQTLIEGEPVHSFVEDNSSATLLGSATAGELISEDTAESLIGTEAGDLQQEALDETQVEEDPSIAIDQFIKKIADEQLSSKRIEERKEEEAQEQNENDKNINPEEQDVSNVDINEAIDNENITMAAQDNPQVDAEKPQDMEKAVAVEEPENQVIESEKPEAEPMEVDGDIDTAPTEKFDMLAEKIADKMDAQEDEHMAESIEEIQKEINRIPPKKVVDTEEQSKTVETSDQNDKLTESAVTNSNGTDHMEDESIEQILGGDTPEKPNVGAILKHALEKEPKLPTVEDSNEVAKDSMLIELAKEEIRKLDVLVCGLCHNTFYYIQELQDHKKGKCPQKSSVTVSCEMESKPQVWGFVLWKAKQTKDSGDNAPSSWAIYQKWCKLPQADKNAWITAGQSIQFASKISNAKVTEVRSAKPSKQATIQKISDSSPPPLEFVDNNKENSSMDLENSATNIIKKGFTKPVKLNNDVTIMPSAKKDEFIVEKIMAKRFNPRKKTWEYNIKWENFGHDSNTWEPISNLSHCKKLLEQFEEQLKRMKEEKAKQAQSPKGRGRPANPKTGRPSGFVPIAPKISNVVGGVSDDYAGVQGNSGIRPQRSSKQKAMNQVKQWCGSISDEDQGGLKRKFETDDDSDDDFDDKKIKLEDDSDYSDKEIVKPKISIKRVTTASSATKQHTPIKVTPVKNGNTSQVLPSNILIPDANGVVRINQKQLPALSSGVYIMSKTAGIIKLDSTTSKVATSGGQTIVKVAPKIGQTQIKIVKKDGNTTKQIIQVSPKTPIISTPQKVATTNKTMTPRFTPKIRKEVKKAPPFIETSSAKITPKKIDVPTPKKVADESDSDDGLEPLPFPDPDEPIPDLEEENKDEEFVLDPETGKIAGREYVDKPVVIKQEPQPLPPSTNELENIVKIAAADLSDEDLQGSDSQDDPLFTTKIVAKPAVKVESTQEVSSTPNTTYRKIVKYTVGGQGIIKAESSPMLNKSLQGQRAVSSSSTRTTPQLQRRVVQQPKVINQMVSQRTPGQQSRTVVRHVIEPSRPGQGGNINVIRKTVTSSRFNLSPQKPMPSPLQPTRTYSTVGGVRQTSPANQGNKLHVYSSKSNVPASQTTSQMVQQGGVRRIGNTVVRSTGSGQQVQRQQVQQRQQQSVTRIVQRVVSSPKKPQQQQQQLANRNLSQVQIKPPTPVKPRTVINMPSLTEDDAPALAVPKVHTQTKAAAPQQQQKPVTTKVSAPAATIKPEPVAQEETSTEVPVLQAPEPAVATAAADGTADNTDWSSFTMADGENPIYVTGDDGTIYQVAGQNEQGQTILITQGPDGQQQCLLVTNEISEMVSDEPQPSTSTAATTSTAEAAVVAAVPEPESAPVSSEIPPEAELAVPTLAATVDESLQTPLEIKTDGSEMEGIEDGAQDQVVAQVVRAEPPSPGGTHKVVVMLPDGNLMVTQVSPEEYASLELE